MVSFIDAHREEYGVEPMCKVLPIAPSRSSAVADRGEPSMPSVCDARMGRLFSNRRVLDIPQVKFEKAYYRSQAVPAKVAGLT